jgi:uncharacterized protein
LNALSRILIVGASTRAAAQSAIRAGFHPTCADQFADEDLREIADVLTLPRYPDDLPKVVANSPDCPWIYTGALENRPALLQKLAALRPLLGNPADVVRAVRNPFRLYRALVGNGLPALEVRPTDEPPPQNGDWMLKPCRGSAGRGIYLWDSAAPNLNDLGEPYYFQERAGGRGLSGLYLASGGTTTLIGATEQWIGHTELSARPFAYCGSIGPIDLPEPAGRQIADTGDHIAFEFGLRGLFGIDFLLEGEVAWPTEVNPRYTASVEIYERSHELALLDWHVRACRCHAAPSHSRDLMDQFRSTLTRARVTGGGHKAAKAIVYAPFGLQAPNLARLQQTPDFSAAGIEIADRPAVGLPLPQGTPICTLITSRTNSHGRASFDRALSMLAIEFEGGRI